MSRDVNGRKAAAALPHDPFQEAEPLNTSGEAWPDPIPLGAGRLSPFPVESLPGWLGSYVRELARAVQVPPDLPAMLALAVTAAAVAPAFSVEVRRGYVEPLNLWVAVALPPGSRKSAVISALIAPILDAEKELRDQRLPMIREAQLKRGVLEKQIERAHRPRNEGEPDLSRILTLSRDLEAIQVPSLPRLVLQDATPEAAVEVLVEQGGAVAVLSAEGELFEVLGGRYAQGGRSNIEAFNKGHAGEAVRVDRKGRAPLHLDRAVISVGIAIQPDVVRRLADKDGFRGSGFLARFLFSTPRSNVGMRKASADPVPAGVDRAYRERMLGLGRLGLAEPGQVLNLTPAARAIWDSFFDYVEPRLAEGAPLAEVADWGGKLCGAVARIAGLLHLALAEGAARREPVSAPTMEAAVKVGRYLIPHALVAFALIGADPRTDKARRLLAWLVRQEGDRIVRRDIHAALRGTFRKVADLAEALDLLAELHWLRVEGPRLQGRPGHPGAPVVLLNPKARQTIRTIQATLGDLSSLDSLD